MCEFISDAGFFSGLWAGLVAIFSILGDIFFDVIVYDRCQDSWWYDLGFLAGFAFIGVYAVRFSWLILLVVFLAWLVWLTIGAILWSGAFALGAIIVLSLWISFTKHDRTRRL